MKLILALSLCLMLPIHAMDSEKNAPHTHLLAQTTEASAQRIKQARRKKIAAAVFITLLTTGGAALNGVSTYLSLQPITHQVFPYTEQLPANNATCTYQTTIAQRHEQETSLPIANPFGAPKPTLDSERCFADQTAIPDTYCDCKTPPCKVILETCQDKDPSKKNVVAASMGAVFIQLCVLVTYLATYVTPQ